VVVLLFCAGYRRAFGVPQGGIRRRGAEPEEAGQDIARGNAQRERRSIGKKRRAARMAQSEAGSAKRQTPCMRKNNGADVWQFRLLLRILQN
jgi:hypothetical protein